MRNSNFDRSFSVSKFDETLLSLRSELIDLFIDPGAGSRAKFRAKSPIAQKALLEKGIFGSDPPGIETKFREEISQSICNI